MLFRLLPMCAMRKEMAAGECAAERLDCGKRKPHISNLEYQPPEP
jgi:hypothetical protein